MDVIVSTECHHWKPQIFVPPAKALQIDFLWPIIRIEQPSQRQYTEYVSDDVVLEINGDTM